MERIFSKKKRRELINYVTFWLAYHTGHGPERIKVSSNSEVVVIDVSGILTPLEKTLLYLCSDFETVYQIRKSIADKFSADWMDVAQKQFGFILNAVIGQVNLCSDRMTLFCKVEKSDLKMVGKRQVRTKITIYHNLSHGD
ncbi:MAG: DUF2294 family protein [Firmicutes bacterium]|nr:DUF2294 family protein [Bacillota bacterium]